MAFLSDRGTTTSPENGEFHIIKPNAGSPTGFDSFRISKENLFKDINEDIVDVDDKATSNTDRIDSLESVSTREEIIDQVNPFTFTQPANSTITKIVSRGENTETLLIGTTGGGSQIASITFSNEYHRRSSLKKEIDTRNEVSIHFTPTGKVSVQIYYEKNTI